MQPTWMRKSNFEILFKDSPDYFSVLNARLILAVNGWVIFHVFSGDTFVRQEMYPSQHIHRIKQLPLPEPISKYPESLYPQQAGQQS
jgi:hypothetical protein